MLRGISIFFGLCLAALFVVGLSVPAWTTWLTWLDFVAMLCAFAVAAAAPKEATTRAQTSGAWVVAIGVLVLWIVGLMTNAQMAQTWFNFIVGVIYLIATAASVSEQRKTTTVETPSQWRKSA